MNNLKVSFLIITTHGQNHFEFAGSPELLIDVLDLINSRIPEMWFDNTQHRKMYRYDESMIKAVNDFASKHGKSNYYTPFELRKFMKNFKKDEPFYIFRTENYLSIISQIDIAHAVFQLEAIKLGKSKDAIWDLNKDNIACLLNNYTIYTFGNNNYNSGSVSDERICRFCGRTKAAGATFQNIAHAIPEALGNKTLKCNEECDECNKSLAPIEDCLSIGHLGTRRSILGIHGKNGQKSTTGQNFVYDAGEKVLVVDEMPPKATGDIACIRLSSNYAYTNQCLYKALVKIVIDIIDTKDLTHFHNTIEWIKGNLIGTEFSPIKQYYCDNVHPQPILELFIRKNENNTDVGPYCFANLFVCDLVLQYIVPFIDVDMGKMKSYSTTQKFESMMGATIDIYHWKSEWIDCEDTTLKTAWDEFEFNNTFLEPTNEKILINEKLKITPINIHPEIEKFPKFTADYNLNSKLYCSEIFNINTKEVLTEERLHNTSNNILSYFEINNQTGKILVEILIDLCNTDNTIHFLDMCIKREYEIKNLNSFFHEVINESISIDLGIIFYLTALSLLSLNPELKKIHPLLDVKKLDLETICSHHIYTLT